jgi:thioredoxin 1
MQDIIMADTVVHLTDANFDNEVTKHDKPVLVDFWASWCAPCRAIAPLLEDLAQQYVGKVKIAKLNVDDEPNSATHYGIRALPTLLLFNKGEVVEQVVGAVSKSRLDELIKSHLA